MRKPMTRFNRWSSPAVGCVVAMTLGWAAAADAVPIDLTDATPSVTGSTTLHIDGISTLGATYWADFR